MSLMIGLGWMLFPDFFLVLSLERRFLFTLVTKRRKKVGLMIGLDRVLCFGSSVVAFVFVPSLFSFLVSFACCCFVSHSLIQVLLRAVLLAGRA